MNLAFLFLLATAGVVQGHTIYSNSFREAGGDPVACAEICPGLSSYNLWTALDGTGHLVPTNTHGSTRLTVQLSEHPVFSDSGVSALRATVVLTAPATNWVGVGFQESTAGTLNSTNNTGPWLLIMKNSISIRGGTGVNGSLNQFLNTHSPGTNLTIEMTCYSNQTVDLRVNGALITSGLAITNVDASGTSVSPTYQCMDLQFFSQPTDGTVYVDSLAVSKQMAGVFSLIYSNSFREAGGDPVACAEISSNLSSYNLWTELDGAGHLVPTNTHGSTRLNVQLSENPVFSDSGVSALRATAVLTAPTTNWVGVGFQESTAGTLNSTNNTGPWLLIMKNSILIRGGTGVNGSLNQFLNTHSPGTNLTIEMTCYPNQTVDLRVNGALITSGLAITNVDASGTSASPTYQCMNLQFYSQPTDGTVYVDRVEVQELMTPDIHFLKEEFGAVCDGITDDASALKAALDAAACSGDERFELRLPANATIRLNTNYFSSQLFSVSGLNHFYLNGNNSTFLIGKGADGSLTGKGLFNLSGITNSMLCNFTVDYEEAPWSQGDLVGIDTVNQKIIVTNDAGYMAADDPRLSNVDTTWITLHDADGLLAYPGVLYVTAATNLSNGYIQLDYIKWPATIDADACSRYVRVWRSGGGHVFNFQTPKNLILDGIRIYASPCMGFVFNNARPGVQIVNCTIEPKPGTDRMISSTADGIHFLGASTEGPLIENNTLVKLEDDAIVVHCQGAYIYEASGSTVYLQRADRRITWEVGDRFGLYNFNKNECFTNGMITSLTAGIYPSSNPVYPNELYWKIVLDKPIPAGFQIEPVSSFYDTNKTLTVAYDLSKCNENTVIRNNVVEYNRGKGILANGSGFVIAGNMFSYTTMPGMMLGSTQRYCTPEENLTFPIQNTLIVSNILYSTQNYGGYQSSLGRSSIFCSNWDKLINDYAQDSFFNQSITICDNLISYCGYSAIRFNSASNCMTSGNVFDSLNRQVESGETYAIEYENCVGMDDVNANNVVTNCTVTQEVKVW